MWVPWWLSKGTCWGCGVKVLAAQSCLTLRDPTDCSPLGSSVQGILQARISEWVASPFSGGSSRPMVSCAAGDSLPSEPPGSLRHLLICWIKTCEFVELSKWSVYIWSFWSTANGLCIGYEIGLISLYKQFFKARSMHSLLSILLECLRLMQSEKFGFKVSLRVSLE